MSCLITGLKGVRTSAQRPLLGGRASPLDRELAFWIQFAETWKDLADFCGDPDRRAGCLDRVQVCLRRASIVQQKLERIPSRGTRATGRQSLNC